MVSEAGAGEYTWQSRPPKYMVERAKIELTRRQLIAASVVSLLTTTGILAVAETTNLGGLRDKSVRDILKSPVKGFFRLLQLEGFRWESGGDQNKIEQPSDKFLYKPIPQEVSWYKEEDNKQEARSILTVGGMRAWVNGRMDIKGVDDFSSREELEEKVNGVVDSMIDDVRMPENKPDRLSSFLDSAPDDGVAYSEEEAFLWIAESLDDTANFSLVRNRIVEDSMGNISLSDEKAARRQSRSAKVGCKVLADALKILGLGGSRNLKANSRHIRPQMRGSSGSIPARSSRPSVSSKKQPLAFERNQFVANELARTIDVGRRNLLKAMAAGGVGLGVSGLAVVAERALASGPLRLFYRSFEAMGADDVLVMKEVDDKYPKLLSEIYQSYQKYKEGTIGDGSVTVTSRNGYPMASKKSVYASLKDIPLALRSGLTLLEDKRIAGYITESGVDPESFFNTVVKQVAGRSGGGSNLLQQVIKNKLYSPEEFVRNRGPVEKAAEINLAMLSQMYMVDLIKRDDPNISEEDLTKKMVGFIQEMYFNSVQFGPGIVGIKQASQYFWGTSDLSKLQPIQLLIMMTRPNQPSVLSIDSSPDEFRDMAKWTKERLEEICKKDYGKMDFDMYKEVSYLTSVVDVSRGDLNLSTKVISNGQESSYLDYLTGFVLSWQEMSNVGGELVGSIDPRIQGKLNRLIVDYGKKYSKGHRPIIDVLVRDSQNGEILACTGDLAVEQPAGSVVKPFAYAHALNNGVIQSDISFLDKKVEVDLPDVGKVWEVRNFGDNPTNQASNQSIYSGENLTIGQALASSSNVAAARVAAHLGAVGMTDALARFGLGSGGEESVMDVLGVGGQNMVRTATGYSVFGNEGMATSSTPILAGRGYSAKLKNQPVVSASVARFIAGELARDLNFPWGDKWNILKGASKEGVPFFSKTGTPDNQSCVWCCGGTLPSTESDLDLKTVVVRLRWEGSDGANSSGLTDAGPLYRQIMDEIAHVQPLKPVSADLLADSSELDFSVDATQSILEGAYSPFVGEYLATRGRDVKELNYQGVVLHWTGTGNMGEALNHLTNPDTLQKSHFLIDRNGKIFSLMDPWTLPAYSVDSSDVDLNSGAVSIEMVGTSRDSDGDGVPSLGDKSDLTEAQIESAAKLTNHLILTGLIPENSYVCGHLHAKGTHNVDPSQAVVDAVGEKVKLKNPDVLVRK